MFVGPLVRKFEPMYGQIVLAGLPKVYTEFAGRPAGLI